MDFSDLVTVMTAEMIKTSPPSKSSVFLQNDFDVRCIKTRVLPIGLQFAWLFLLAMPIACVAWTITHEEVFRESRDYCQKQSKQARTLPRRKFFYLFTCEYCFSHYVSAGFLILTRFKLLYPDWRGYVVALFSLVWVANQYMSIYNHLRLDIRNEQVEIKAKEIHVQNNKGMDPGQKAA